MASFLGEIRRRKIFQVGAVYLVVAWMIMQIVDVVNEPLSLPDWFDTVVILFLAIGFPISLIISWAFDVTAEGLVRDTGRVPRLQRGRRVEYVLVALLVVAAGWIAYRELDFSTSSSSASSSEPSIAVLPFANLSADPDQEFFAEGIAEEIGFALSRVQGLNVVGRSSAFQFGGQARDLREIGRTLGATHLIEGSVRRSGSEVLVTTQLVSAASGLQILANSYRRELTDVFEVQEEIARAVTSSLQVPLGLRGDERLVADPGITPDDYSQFLRASRLFHSRGLESIKQAVELLLEIVSRNQGFARAWALLAQAYSFVPNFEPAWLSADFEQLAPIVADTMPKAEMAARRALDLDPNLAAGHYALALALELQGQLIEADQHYQQAFALAPDDPDVLHLYSRFLASVGRLEDALALRQRLLVVDPLVPIYRAMTAWVLWLNGRDGEATEMGENLQPLLRSYTLSPIVASQGRYDYAAEVIESAPAGMYLPGTVEDATRLLRSAPIEIPSPESLPRLGLLEFVSLYIGAPLRALDPFEESVRIGYSVSIFNALLWHSSYAEVRRTERFKMFLHDAGVVEYWDENGWPEEFCSRVTSEDFVCE